MMREASFVATATTLADGPGAVIRTAPAGARPRPGATVLLDDQGVWRIAAIAGVLAHCGDRR